MVPRPMDFADINLSLQRQQAPKQLQQEQAPQQHFLGWQVGGAASPKGKGFAFISKSLLDAQRNAESDLKLLSERTSSLKQMVPQMPPSLDEWEKIRIPLTGGKEVTAGELMKQFQDSSRRALAGGNPLSSEMGGSILPMQDPLDVVKSLQLKVPPALTKLQKLPELSDGPPKWMPQWPPFDPLQLSQQPPPQLTHQQHQQHHQATQSEAGSIQQQIHQAQSQSQQQLVRSPAEAVLLKPFDGKQFITFDDWNRAVRQQKWQLPGAESWEPLKRVKEGLKELEQSAASATPSDLLDIVKKNLNLPETPRAVKRQRQQQFQKGTDVAPLDVPELLEALARSSEVLLEQLGVKQEVSTKLSGALRLCRDASQKFQVGLLPAPQHAGMTGSASASSDASGAGDAERRLSEVMDSTGYHYKEDGGLSLLLGAASLFNPKIAAKQGRDGKKKPRHIAVVTTASLPWMTGTAVNPLLRAAYLAHLGGEEEEQVTLMVPWLSKVDQEAVYPNKITFDSPAQQAEYVRSWLTKRVGFCPPNLKIAFYPGKFSREKRSILAAGDISSFIPDHEADVAVLEEPEHLTWYYHGKRWTDKFRRVVGIIHTNYLEYVKREKNGPLQAFLLEHVNNWMVRCYCHKVVRLSGATQDFPRSMVCNVHGVGSQFLSIGDAMATELQQGRMPFSKGAYYLGKMVWGKGYRELVDLLHQHADELGSSVGAAAAGASKASSSLHVDVFGSGEDAAEVRAEAQAKGLRMKFHKGRDHADASLHQFKVFINPSLSDVVCTTTAEALAMGKIVVCADHPSNEFFRAFPNCYIYRNPSEFPSVLQRAMAATPLPLTPEQRHLLTWEAATHRFLQAAEIESLPGQLAAGTAQLKSGELSKSAGTLPQVPELDGVPMDAGPGAVAAGEGFHDVAVGSPRAMRASGSKPSHANGKRRSQSCNDLQSLGSDGSDSTTTNPAATQRGLVKKFGARPLPGLAGPRPQLQLGQLLQHAMLPASLTLSLPPPPDMTEHVDRFLSFAHFMASGVEAARVVAGAAPDSMHVGEDLSREMGLPPPWVQRPTYGW